MVSYTVAQNTDEFGIEAMNEGYHDVFEEGLFKHNIHKLLKDGGMDAKFEQDLSKYPDYFKIYSENYKRYDEINKNAENIAPGEFRDIFEVTKIKPERPGAMRSWVSKWDADYNTTFKGLGPKVESNNKQ